MVTRVTVSTIMALSLCSLAFGKLTPPALVEGDRFFTFGGGGSSDQDFDTTVVATNASVGHFFTPRTAGVIRQDINFAGTLANDSWSGSTRVACNYHFGNGAVLPFVGANIGFLYGDGVKEQFIAGPEVGLKAFLTPETFIYVNVEYQYLFEDADMINNNFDDGRFVYSLGMGFRH